MPDLEKDVRLLRWDAAFMAAFDDVGGLAREMIEWAVTNWEVVSVAPGIWALWDRTSGDYVRPPEDPSRIEVYYDEGAAHQAEGDQYRAAIEPYVAWYDAQLARQGWMPPQHEMDWLLSQHNNDTPNAKGLA